VTGKARSWACAGFIALCVQAGCSPAKSSGTFAPARLPLDRPTHVISDQPASAPTVLGIPDAPETQLYTSRVVASHLLNPRGMLPLADGSLLVAEAGFGDPRDAKTGRIMKLTDRNRDGDYDDENERSVVLERLHSVNILGRLPVNRDEVFGLADLEAGAGVQLATVADPLEGTTILRIDGALPSLWATTPDNANSIAYHPGLKRWFAVQSFANTVIELSESGAHRMLTRIAQLEQGQDPVPAAIVVEPGTNALLVALFSGQLGGDTGGSGVDFVERSGRIVRIDPQSGKLQPLISGLNAPTDLAVAEAGVVYVLEFCRHFRDPVHTPAEAQGGVRDAGFERFSGRLLRIELERAAVNVVADHLDLPTHLRWLGPGRLLVSVGQGTPGRMLPGPSRPTRLEGRIVELEQHP
jgi:hypothetical protein